MKFFNFHLMPYRHVDIDAIGKHGSAWVTFPNSHYDPVKGAELYHDYLDQMENADRLGFGDDATPTKDPSSIVAYACTGRMEFPLKEPPERKESPAINRLYADKMLGDASRYRKKALKRWLRGILGIKKAGK